MSLFLELKTNSNNQYGHVAGLEIKIEMLVAFFWVGSSLAFNREIRVVKGH